MLDLSMSALTQIRFLAVALFGILFVGCGTADVTTPAKVAKVSEPKPKADVPQKAADKVENAEKAQPSEPSSTTSETVAEAPAEFEPPYPNRENLFLAPKRNAATKKHVGSTDQAIELLGFANVNGPRVILSINGNVTPLSEGSQEAGIEVISIQPPAVVLQRDRERWQATLEN